MIGGIALAAALLGASAQAIPATDRDFQASGSEPFWSLRMDGRQMIFSDNGEDTAVAQPRPVRSGASRRYVTRPMTVIVSPGPCEDEAMLTHVNTVRVLTRGRRYEGCGGGILSPEDLDQTAWRILSIDGADVSGEDRYDLDFSEGRVSGRAGCNQMSGAYRQAAAQLTVGPITATEMACPAPHMTHERAVMAILRAGPRISFPDPPGNEPPIMVLTSSAGTIRLQLV